MHSRVHKELFIHKDYHVLHCTKDLCLYPRWSVWLTESNEGSEDIYTVILMMTPKKR